MCVGPDLNYPIGNNLGASLRPTRVTGKAGPTGAAGAKVNCIAGAPIGVKHNQNEPRTVRSRLD